MGVRRIHLALAALAHLLFLLALIFLPQLFEREPELIEYMEVSLVEPLPDATPPPRATPPPTVEPTPPPTPPPDAAPHTAAVGQTDVSADARAHGQADRGPRRRGEKIHGCHRPQA